MLGTMESVALCAAQSVHSLVTPAGQGSDSWQTNRKGSQQEGRSKGWRAPSNEVDDWRPLSFTVSFSIGLLPVLSVFWALFSCYFLPQDACGFLMGNFQRVTAGYNLTSMLLLPGVCMLLVNSLTCNLDSSQSSWWQELFLGKHCCPTLSAILSIPQFQSQCISISCYRKIFPFIIMVFDILLCFQIGFFFFLSSHFTLSQTVFWKWFWKCHALDYNPQNPSASMDIVF